MERLGVTTKSGGFPLGVKMFWQRVVMDAQPCEHTKNHRMAHFKTVVRWHVDIKAVKMKKEERSVCVTGTMLDLSTPASAPRTSQAQGGEEPR